MFPQLRRLYRFRELLYMLSLRDFKLRYKDMTFGLLWTLLMPVAVVMAGLVIRLAATKAGVVQGLSVASVIVKAIVWAFFITCLRATTASLVGNSNLVSKVAFPKEVFPLSAIIARLIDFVISIVAGLAALFFLRHDFPSTAMLAPVLLLPLLALITGLGLLVSSLNLFFKDIRHVIEIVILFGIFFTPVLYDVEMLGQYSTIALLNPLAPILEGFKRTIVLGTLPDPTWMTYSCVFSFVVLIFGYRVFKRLEHLFAERI